MKKTILLAVLVAFIAGCGGNDKKTTETTTTNNNQPAENPATQNPTPDATKNADYQKGLDLITKNDCFTCHEIADKKIGPPYMEVAKKYAGQPGIEDTLANKVIKGGSGHWGQVMMTPHANLSHDDAVTMVKYILSLNQQ